MLSHTWFQMDRAVKIWCIPPMRAGYLAREDKPLFTTDRIHRARVLSIAWYVSSSRCPLYICSLLYGCIPGWVQIFWYRRVPLRSGVVIHVVTRSLMRTEQVRSKLSTFGGFGGPTDVTCGGNALKFYASVRLNIKRIAFVKKAEEVWKICSFLCFFAFSCAVWLARSNASVN